MRHKRNNCNPVDVLSEAKYNTFINSRNKRDYEYGWNANSASNLQEKFRSISSSSKKIVNLPNFGNSLKILNQSVKNNFIDYPDKEVGIESKFIKYPYRMLNMKDQKIFIKSMVDVQNVYQMNLKSRYILNQSLGRTKDSNTPKNDTKILEMSTEAYSQSIKQKDNNLSRSIPPINGRYKGQPKLQSRNHRLIYDELRKANRSTNISRLSDFRNLSSSQEISYLSKSIEKRASSK